MERRPVGRPWPSWLPVLYAGLAVGLVVLRVTGFWPVPWAAIGVLVALYVLLAGFTLATRGRV